MTAISTGTPQTKPRALPFDKKKIYFAICIALGVFIWVIPAPEGLNPKAWKVFALFVYTIAGMILNPIPRGALTITSLAVLLITKITTFAEAFQGFSNPTVWLITIAFFFARGFIKTGLGLRLAYNMMTVCGRTTLGMAYGLVFTDWILGSAIPSVTARAGGIMYPLVSSVSKAFDSHPGKNPNKIGAYLIKTVFQCGAVTSAMFLTAMAGNPMVQGLAEKCGVSITWGSWALAAIVPGMCSLILIPIILLKIYPPEIKDSSECIKFSKEKLKEMGRVTRNEWIMIFAFVVMITLWATASIVGLSAAVTALLGLTILIISGVLSWDEILSEKGAFDTLFWFASLFAMATLLSKFGFMEWFSFHVGGKISGYNPVVSFLLIALLYYYSHYLFASNIAHITAMYAPFLLLAIATGAPPALAAFTLGFMSSLFGSLTTYGCGPAPIFYGSGYVSTKDWWRLGFIISVVNVVIWLGVGTIWWRIIGLF